MIYSDDNRTTAVTPSKDKTLPLAIEMLSQIEGTMENIASRMQAINEALLGINYSVDKVSAEVSPPLGTLGRLFGGLDRVDCLSAKIRGGIAELERVTLVEVENDPYNPKKDR